MTAQGSSPEYPQAVIKARRRLIRELGDRMPRSSRDQCATVADWLLERGYLTPAFFAWGSTPYPTPGDFDLRTASIHPVP